MSDADRRGGRDPSETMDGRLSLAYAATALKDVERAGWVLRGVRNPESVADHSFGTALLCLLYAQEAGVDRKRAMAVALVHDLAEAVTGDLVARADTADREVSLEEKARAEIAAMAKLPGADAVHELWQEYEESTTPEALFVRDMNLLDMCLQALRYEAGRRYDASQPVPSSGGYVHLDEFFVSAESRLTTALGRRLFGSLKGAYEEIRRGTDE